MAKHDLQERLINGFSRHGYELYADDNLGMSNEFRKPDTALRFIVKPGEGAMALFWTESTEHDMIRPTLTDIFRNLPKDVDVKTFCGSAEEFWQAVKDVIGGK